MPFGPNPPGGPASTPALARPGEPIEAYDIKRELDTGVFYLDMEKGEFQQAEVLFKKTLDIQGVPNAYYGLALLYRMAGKWEAARAVLETYFTRFSHQKGTADSRLNDEG